MRARTLFGRPLGIGLILIQKSVWFIVLVAISAAFFVLHAKHVAYPVRAIFAGELVEDPHDLLAHLVLGFIPEITLRGELLLAIVAAVYAVLEGIEIWGLWRDVLWVEVLIVVETAALLPYEIWEIVRHPSPFKGISLIINALIVWYLAARYLRKREERLLRGPRRRPFEAERRPVS